MSFEALEASAYSGSPIEIYHFYNQTTSWRYTSADADIVHDTATYYMVPISRGPFTQTKEVLKSNLEVRASRDLGLVQDSMYSPLLGVVNLRLYRAHRGDNDFRLWWAGRVDGIKFEGNETVLDCSPIASSLKRYGLRRPAQRMCPHGIYDGGCGLLDISWGVPGALTGLTGNVLSAVAFGAQPDGYWVGGKIRIGGAVRMVVAHTGTNVTISASIPGLAANASFTIYPGCDHTPATCNSRFSNIANYGGAPWLPIKNPFSGDSAF